MTDEEFVRANWEVEEPIQWHENYHDERFYHAEIGGKHLACHRDDHKAWAAAAEFTRERLEQIRLLVLEIEYLCVADYSDELGNVSNEADEAQERTRLRLADALGELKQGMRTAAPGGARSDAND